MYESEANYIAGALEELPSDIVSRFQESRNTVSRRTLIPWSEHCTECVWPTCYQTCDLYAPREDARCRRFVEGMVRIDCPGSLNSYVVKISFKRWGKLWAPASLNLKTLAVADRQERRDIRVASYIHFIPVAALERTLTLKRYGMKKRGAVAKRGSEDQPNCFLVECYNPNDEMVSVTLTARQDPNPAPFQALLAMAPGFNRFRLDMAGFAGALDFSEPFGIDLTPNDIADGLTLYFGAMDFVVDSAFRGQEREISPAAKLKDPPPCKCIVWDLDNTLWDGTLIEDGPESIRLRPGIAAILNELDERGILLSIASKNSPADAMALLQKFGIAEYFLFPQISWGPKGDGVRQIAASLNIAVDSLLFIDDSAFERQQVQSTCNGIRVLDGLEYRSILDRADCKLPVTAESKNRRSFYREQQTRDTAKNEFGGEYLAFLRNCRLHLTVRTMTEANLERVYELTQRTNQMNFSGNRYTRGELRDLLDMDDADTYVLDCEDAFGSYGTVGFCVMRRRGVHMTDLMFSCRIQAKRVEHAAMSYLIDRYRKISSLEFSADYRKTSKNAVPGKVFEDFGFRSIGEEAGVTKLVFPATLSVPDDSIVTVEDCTASLVSHHA